MRRQGKLRERRAVGRCGMRGWRLAVMGLLLGGSVCDGRVAVGSQMPSQQDVESVYLFDFGKFVRWPLGQGQGPMRICIDAAPSFASSMERTVAGEQIDGRAVEVRRVARPGELDSCTILFMDATQRAHEQEMLSALDGKPTLTVSDAPGFLEHGGMIQFQLVQSRVRFAVNLGAVNHGNLSMSSELLKVALRVEGTPSSGGGH